MKVVRRLGLEQELVTPWCPERNGIIWRFVGILEAQSVWQQCLRHRGSCLSGDRWMEGRYHEERPHQALGDLAPGEDRERPAARTVQEPGNTTGRLFTLRNTLARGFVCAV